MNGCESCGSLSPGRCQCSTCEHCDQEYTPTRASIAGVREHLRFCSVTCEENDETNRDETGATRP